MIYIYEVGYATEISNLPCCVKEVDATNPKEGEIKLKKEVPTGMKIRKITLIGSRKY